MIMAMGLPPPWPALVSMRMSTGASPVWLTAGDTEILLDDTRRMAVVLRDAGVQVSEVIERDLPHVWPIFHNLLPEARHTLRAVAAWMRTLA